MCESQWLTCLGKLATSEATWPPWAKERRILTVENHASENSCHYQIDSESFSPWVLWWRASTIYRIRWSGRPARIYGCSFSYRQWLAGCDEADRPQAPTSISRFWASVGLLIVSRRFSYHLGFRAAKIARLTVAWLGTLILMQMKHPPKRQSAIS